MSDIKGSSGPHDRQAAKRPVSEKAKKQDTLEKIVHLQTKVNVLERERSSHLYSKRHEFRSSFATLEEYELQLNRHRRNEKQELQQHVARIKSSVAAFRRMLADMKPGPAFVEKLKVALEEVEAAITAFKEKQRQIYESLLLEERTVTQEVTVFEKRLDSWLTAKHPSQAAAPTTTAARPASSSSLPPAVAAFERFLQQTGGRQGGWDDYDHKTFLRIKSNKGQPAFIEAATRELPTKSASEVEQHDQWYTEYCTLLERKKKAIEEWKTSKQLSKGEPLSPKTEDASGENTSKRPTREHIFAKEREERFKKLSAWKAQHELKQIEAEEEKLKSQIEKAKEIEKEKKRREAIKERVSGYALLKEEEELLLEQRRLESQAEELERRKTATRELARFRERDTVAAVEKKQIMHAKEAERLEKERRLEQLKEKVVAPRDPSRLHRLTAGWEERKKAGPGSALHTIGKPPRRAVPSWRQGL